MGVEGSALAKSVQGVKMPSGVEEVEAIDGVESVEPLVVGSKEVSTPGGVQGTEHLTRLILLYRK